MQHPVSKVESKQQINRLSLLFACTYMVSYLTRINYGAIISEIAADTGIAKSVLSMSITGSFITYGVGQVISGFIGDRISPKKLVSVGLIATALMNLLIPVCGNPYLMCAVWCVNGFAQSLMWPPLVRLMSMLLTEDDFKRVSTRVVWGSSVGTILVYLLSPLVITAFGWRLVFVFSSSFAVMMLLVWNRYSFDITEDHAAPRQKLSGSFKPLLTPVMLGVMVAVALQGMLRDGITTWMPSYIAETYSLSNILSILTGIVLPVFSIVCTYFATELYRRKISNPLICAGVFYAAGGIAALVLFLFTGRNAAASVLFSALLTGSMHGVNHILVSMIPPYFKKYGMVSTASGVINACTYIGSAASTYGIAVLSETIGWQGTVLVWFMIAVIGTVVTFLSVAPWRRDFGSKG